MTDTFLEKLALAEKYIYTTKFPKTKKVLEELLNDKKLTEEQRLTTIVMKAEYLNLLGEHKKSLEILDEVIKATENEKSLLKVNALNNAVYAFCLLGNLPETIRLLQEIEKLLEELENIPKIDFEKSKMLFLATKINFYYFTADPSNLKKYCEELITLAKKYKNDFFLFVGWLNIGSYYNLIGDIPKVREVFSKELATIAEKTESEMLKIFFEFFSTSFYQPKSLKEMYDKIKLMEEQISAYEALGSKVSLGVMYNNLAVMYSNILDTDKALDYFHKSYNIYQLSFGKTHYLMNVGDQYFVKRDLETARDYYQQALEYSLEIKSHYWIGKMYGKLIPILIDFNLLDQANEYLEDFKQIVEVADQVRLTNSYKIASAKVLKASSKMKDWVKAQEIFEDLLTKKITDTQIIAVYFNSSEILLKELQMTGDDETLEKLKENISVMIDHANKHVQHNLTINLLRFESKLAVIEYDESKTNKLLLEAKTIAENSNLSKLVAEIEEERIALEKQKDFWQTSKQKDEPLTARLEHIEISKTLRDVKEKTVIDERNKETGQFLSQQKLFAIKF
ncbi:MAG: tetratricopeptide repeat protein [Candidatus Heimdallarchaeota archaeon]